MWVTRVSFWGGWGGDCGLVGEGIWVGHFFSFFRMGGCVGWGEGLHENFLLWIMEGEFGFSFWPYHSKGIESFF
jgi:hypothetical protein